MKQLLLLGGGHAHAFVLRSLIGAPIEGVRVTLVAPSRQHLYSGMLPGLIAGHYALGECVIDLAQLAARAGAALIYDRVASIDPLRRVARLARGGEIEYDLASLNLGSLPNFGAVPGAAEHALAAKPFEPFVAAWEALRARGRSQTLRIAVAGGGAAGVELAMAMARALAAGGRAGEIELYAERPAFAPGPGRRVARALARAGVIVHPSTAVEAVAPGPVVRAGNERRGFDALVWATGAAPQPWLAETGLTLDPAGFVLVDETLRSISHPQVFAAGDTATLLGAALPKSGVYAVRQGALLARNLRRAAEDRPLELYTPQRLSLALISCGARYAIASWGPLATEGEWVWRWKDRIDRRWIAAFAP
ncbi:MAG TPA: FAD-dependent oxidoreductase [Burkholderiales bacterium]|nr:FAD-dependent oxidoreductase [Burkholderiales bacterium]